MRHSEGVSYHDGSSSRSTVLREDTDFIDSYINNVDSTGNMMYIRYYSVIEQARVYGFLLRFHCIPTASTILMKKMALISDDSNQDCFIEDNTIELRSTTQARSWRIPGSGDRHFKKMPDSKLEIDRLPNVEALKKSRQGDHSFNKRFKKANHFNNFRYKCYLIVFS